MNWGLMQTVLTIVFGITAIIALIVAIRLAKRKKPVWAYETTKIIGLGTDAPSELKLFFNEKQILDVYRTMIIFFNAGNESIRKNDVTDEICMRFEGAQILRDPRPSATSKSEIRFSVVNRGNDALSLDFFYLDHNDGAVIEVLHTEYKKIACEGNIIGVGKPRYRGKLDRIRPKRSAIRILILIYPLLFFGLLTVVQHFLGHGLFEEGFLWWVLGITVSYYLIGASTLIRFYRYLRFPKWSWISEG